MTAQITDGQTKGMMVTSSLSQSMVITRTQHHCKDIWNDINTKSEFFNFAIVPKTHQLLQKKTVKLCNE